MGTEGAAILSPTDVRKIRSYVQYKYGDRPHNQRAEIIADAINRIIDRQLPVFDEASRRTVAAELIRMAVIRDQRSVGTEDIFNTCLQVLDYASPEVYEPLHSWVEQRMKVTLSSPQFVRVLTEVGSSSEASRWLALKQRLCEEKVRELPLAVVMTPQVPHVRTPELGRSVKARTAIYAALCLLLVGASLLYGWSLSLPSSSVMQPPAVLHPAVPEAAVPADGLPAELLYQAVDKEKLVQYLKGKSSLLAEQPYLDAIIGQAEKFNIHPLLLFAITGQEQGFVPKHNKNAKKIANNPFNVFHSWQEYNTTIQKSAEIASRTIVNLSKGKPKHVDALTWINRKYAEDPNWSNGVRQILAAMQRQIETPAER
ncbi:hypothetical protein ACFO9Q_13110 [Paenibacillus sp. GCM10023252]|uniref:hypothetical protein n=1 Tax=Paenibacillus sp. GCM10023252 TaxID=3252649 RepID=UPI0036220C41